MKKSEMKAKAEGILAKITKFEEEYKKHEQFLDSNTVRQINIQKLREYKEVVNKQLQKIEKLASEEVPPKPEPVEHYTYDDPKLTPEDLAKLNQRADEWQRLNNERREYIALIPQALNHLEHQSDTLMKHLDQFKNSVSDLSSTEIELTQKKGQYIDLSLSIQSAIDQDMYDFASASSLLADPVLKESLKKLQLQQNGYTNLLELIKRDTVKAGAKESKQLAAYDNGLLLLQTYQENYKRSSEEVRSRISDLTSAESVYKEVIVAKNAAVESAKRSVTSANFLLKHDDLAQTKKLKGSTSISELSDLAKRIAAKNREMERTDYMAKAGLIKPAPALFDQINSATRLGLDDKNELTVMVDLLNKKVAEVEQLINETAKQVKTEIEDQKKEFGKIADDIKEKLTAEKVPLSGPLIKLENKFQREVAQTNGDNQNSIAFDQEKLTTLKQITEELKKQVPIEEKRILTELGKNINLIRDNIIERQDRILTTVGKGGFRFNEAERESLDGVRAYRFTSEPGAEQDREVLSAKLKNAQSEKLAFDELYGELDEIVAIHKVAKPIVDKISAKSLTVEELAQVVNESPHGGKLLTALGQYYSGLTKALDENLDLFNAKGISAIKAFVNYDEARLDSIQEKKPLSIQQRLALVTFLSEVKVDPTPFLAQNQKNKDITAAIFYLKEQQLPELITAKNLGNKPFIDALLVLKSNEINLSAPQAASLAEDPNKCAVICQQNELYKKSHEPEDSYDTNKRKTGHPIEEEVFKALIEDFLTSDEQVTAAVNGVSKHAPDYCQPWLLMLVKESEPLQKLLNDEQNLKSNLPFLQILFEDSFTFNITHLPDYLSQSGEVMHNLAVANIQNALNKNNLLTQIEAANTSKNPAFNVGKMGVVMDEINQFALNNFKSNSPENQALNNSLSLFRREAVPILLNPDLELNDKKEQLEELADKHFKNTGIFDRILECIFNAFEKISPKVAEKISEYRSSFFSTQKVAALDHLKKGFEPSGPEVTDEESEESLENDPLIPKSTMNQ